MVRLEVVEVEVDAAEEVKVEDREVAEVQEEEVKETVKEMVKEEEKVRDLGQVQDILVIRHRDMLTYLHLRRASGTGPSGSRRTFVWSRPHAPGRTSGSRSPTIEGLTRPARKIQVT